MQIYLGVFCLWLCQVHHMFEESPLWMLCDWKIQDVDLCNPTAFVGFFIMRLSWVLIILSLHIIFNSMYKGFLDLVWLWCLICGLDHVLSVLVSQMLACDLFIYQYLCFKLPSAYFASYILWELVIMKYIDQ